MTRGSVRISNKMIILFWLLLCSVAYLILYFMVMNGMDDHAKQNPFIHQKKNVFEAKEEFFTFVNHHQEELNALLEEIKEVYETAGEEAIYLSEESWNNDYYFPYAAALIQEYPIMSISVNSKDDINGNKAIAITIYLLQADYFILADDYWGIYYAETGQPLPRSYELTENDGVYYSTYGCIYETEHIIGKWYYFRERW